jgi:hypothetical protein
MQFFMQFFYDAIAYGFLSSLTWMGLVWMSPDRPIGSGRAWVQGVGIIAISNILIWLILAWSNLRLIPLWAICFLLINSAIAGWIFAICEDIKIPKIWALLVHPLAIATMGILLGGATGRL